jgi:predicted PurR-regulated permease PerM
LDPNGQRLARILAGALVVLGSLWLLRNFIPALAWALVIAIATWPLYMRLSGLLPKARRERWSAPIFALLIGVLLFVPLTSAAIQVGKESRIVAHWLMEAQAKGLSVPDWLPGVPLLGRFASEWWQANLGDPLFAEDWLHHLATPSAVEWSKMVGAQLLHRTVIFGFTLLTLYFLYREGAGLARHTLSLASRVLGEHGERYALHLLSALRATVNGLVLVGIGEALLFGIAYKLAGFTHPALLGALTGLFSLVPFAAPLVFGAAALVLAAEGSVVASIALFAFGAVVIFVADHFVRPALISGATRLPFLWVFFGILGGLETFGLLGLFLGPALMAAMISIWRDSTEAQSASPT